MENNSGAKSSENGSTPVGRLPSLRAPRDLTLGNYGRDTIVDPTRKGVKRTFTPNINAAKIKKEKIETPVEAPVPKPSESSRGRDRKDRGGRGHSNRGRGQGRGQQIVYQQTIFENWVSDEPKPREVSYYNSGGGGGGGRESFRSRQSLGKLKVEVKEEAMDEGNVDDMMKDLLNDTFIDNDSLSTVSSAMFPVLLDVAPKQETKVESADVKHLVEGDVSAVDVKAKEDSKNIITGPEAKPKTSVPWTPISQLPLENSVFTPICEDKKFLFIHFPDVLPGFPSAPSTSGGAKTKPEEIQATDTSKSSQSLKDFTEGFIGKMKVRRSGKVELNLSNIVFEGSPLPSKFLQEVVVCEFERDLMQRPVSGDMTVIGHVGHKINFTPKIENIANLLKSTS